MFIREHLILKLWFLILPCIMGGIFSAKAEIYQYVNEQGVTVFTDKPRPDAKQIEVNQNIPNMPATLTQAKSNSAASNQKPQPFVYQITILNPQPQATIRNNQSEMEVSFQLNTEPNFAYQFVIYLDGKAVKTVNRLTKVQLQQVYRGEHQLKVELTDLNGKLIASSKPVIFYMHQASLVPAN
ncbi:DUF4124 domain-containing protein [Catenovulum sp. 2E275]|uniref:DUF4124 domain-containing protein n=1 Tax=Catenovulum sp. 2E275 TaxID=2980497 RepID=UPI0021D192B6|nr:DUF4124 domain-containing protein [Catenovulum sp. 2E275]MCU4676873.1 DUF4124 domain-containing protein [Catenovulum sp. 2E275]